jgi:hypothetical protein
MNEDPSRAPVAVNEGMDCFELGVSDRRLGDGRQEVVAAKCAEVAHKVGNGLGRGRDKGCRARVVRATTDPILLIPKPSSVLFEPGSGEQPAVDVEEQVQRDRIALADRVNPEDHGVDVAEDLRRADIGRWFIQRPDDLSVEQPPRADLQTLDARRRDRLCSEQDAGERFGVDKGGHLGTQAQNGRLSLANSTGDIAIQADTPARKRVRDVGFVFTGPAVSPSLSREIADPPAADYL